MMDPDEYELMYRAEQSHWWYVGMSEITRSVLDNCCGRGRKLRILDAGCGTGGALSWLSDYGTPFGMDLSSHALGFCKRRSHKRVCMGSVMSIPLAGGVFDLVISQDVLYFTGIQDEAALQEFRRVLVPGGRLFVRVPAYDWLRGTHDRKVSTGHRYTRRELKDKMERNGLVPELLTYVNTFLFPIALIKRICDRWLPSQATSDVGLETGCLNNVLKSFLLHEARIIKKRSLPFGLSIVGVGRKEDESEHREKR